jgi:oligopeptide/dipeptide ABC transporter ATP-binding protein
MTTPILELRNMTVEFRSPVETVRAADGLDLEVHHGETFAIVGESGSGKTVSMMAAMRLLPVPPAHVAADAIRFAGEDILTIPEHQWRHYAGKRLAMVFQDALTSLNPVYSIGWQIGEMFRVHRPDMSRRDIRDRVVGLLAEVGIPDPAGRVEDYPHQFSGGMRQRAMIAMGIALTPELLIADEPTTALDVTVEAQIMDLLARLSESHRMSMVLITHDLGLVAENADRVAIMYAGRVMETGRVDDVLRTPRHPYTLGLLAARPHAAGKGQDLRSIPGSPPNLARPPRGCPFHPRCPLAASVCREERPALKANDAGTQTACHAVDAEIGAHQFRMRPEEAFS